MQWAVVSSLAIILAIVYVPFLDPIFATVQLSLREWGTLLPLILLPSVIAELSKLLPLPRAYHRAAEARAR